jgi:hypothetical protein
MLECNALDCGKYRKKRNKKTIGKLLCGVEKPVEAQMVSNG